ncbi:EmrB/QacA family drug resistance transporter [Myxococcus stipitatus DSM 14675]|uniref:EmrB/QacA family drug resistance transporter n=1 Tax=Myxococcus stipitatus (strain DSM 14675 / JCM 12634 / Mx s8) TaxID=1278073 RepID=L7TZP6_MYXSD|nr:MDR family MFS transporter [Myxococcus stipitatus]AGC41443.1 EmrB/QacA family drug resistance transporter [Myxococcus stipitatus DSM 14675]
MASPAAFPTFTRTQKVFTMLGALLGLLLAALDQTIVATAGPSIQADLGIPASLYPWLTTSYLVASTMMVPVWGKLSDLVGRRAVLGAGITVFLLGSFLCGVSRSTVTLILFRAVQGLGSAALFTGALAVVADLFPPRERGKYQGLFGAMFGLSSVVGPLAGGFITDRLGWHWVFFINLPVGAVALALVLLRMPRLRPEGVPRGKLDLAGAGTLALAVVPLLLALSLGHAREQETQGIGWAWGSGPILGLFALAAVGTAAFIRVETHTEEPLLDLRLFKLKTFSLGNAAVFIVGAVFLSGVVFLPLFMVNVVGLSATHSGLTLTPLTLGVVAGNVVSGQLVSRLGRYKELMLGSLLLLAGGFAVMGFTLTPQSTQAEVTVKMVLVGLGLGPSIPLYTVAIQNAVSAQQIGVATSAATFFRQLGMTLGVALMGAVFATTLSHELKTRVAQATDGLPSHLRAELLSATSGAPGEGGPSHTAFEPEALKARLRTELASSRPEQLDDALSAVDRADQALKEAYTTAVKDVYRCAILVALLAFLVTLRLPEQPLTRTRSQAATVRAEDSDPSV